MKSKMQIVLFIVAMSLIGGFISPDRLKLIFDVLIPAANASMPVASASMISPSELTVGALRPPCEHYRTHRRECCIPCKCLNDTFAIANRYDDR